MESSMDTGMAIFIKVHAPILVQEIFLINVAMY